MSKPVESWPASVEYGYLAREVQLGDVFVMDDGPAIVITSVEGDKYEYEELTEEELNEIKRRRWRPWMTDGVRKPPPPSVLRL